MFHVLSRVLVSTSVNGVLTVGSADEAMQDLQFNSSVPGLLACLAHVSMCVCCPYLYASPIPHALHSSFHARLCVKSETAAVLVVTQQDLLNHVQGVEEEDVTDPDVLKAVEAAVRKSMSVKRIEILSSQLRWTNVATAILKGAAQSKPLREVKLVTPEDLPQEVVDDVRRVNPKLRLVVIAGDSASHDIT